MAAHPETVVPDNRLAPWAVILFSLVVAVMIGHEAEHVAQIIQKWFLQAECPFYCRGLLGQSFDLEWVHFVYNGAVFLLLIAVWLGLRMWERHRKAVNRLAWWCLTGGIFAWQGFHMVEHSAKIGQWLVNGHQSPTPGIVGIFLPPPTPHSFSLIEYHFVLNTVVFGLVMFGYFGYRVPQQLPDAVRATVAGRSPVEVGALALIIGSAFAVLGYQLVTLAL